MSSTSASGRVWVRCVMRRPGALRGEGGGGPGRLRHAAGQQRLAGDDEALDLGGALVELHDLRVAHQLLDRVVLDEAVAAVDRTASVVTSIAESAAKRLACEETSVFERPWSR